MSWVGQRLLLRVYLQSADRTPREPTWRRIVKAARSHGLSGCTVLEGIYGAGTTGVLAPSAWGLVQHLPVIVEVVDEPERVAHFIDGPMGELMSTGLATMEWAGVVVHRAGAGDGGPPPTLPPLSDWPGRASALTGVQPRTNMTIDEDGVLVRVFIGESDRADGRPLYEAIVQQVRELGLAGATVLRGVEGFGAHSVVHKAKLLEMSADLPIVIEIVDSAEKVGRLLPQLDSMVKEGMVTVERVRILAYRANAAAGA